MPNIAGWARTPKVEIWHAKDGWRWRLRAGNGRIIAESGEAYTRRRDAFRGVKTVMLVFWAGSLETR